MTLPLSRMLTVLPGVPVPLKVGVPSSMVLPGTMAPVLSPTLSLLAGAAGLAGAVVSEEKFSGSLAGLVLPVGSVSLVVIEWLPSGSGVVGVYVQLPRGSTTAVPMTLPLSRMLTVLPGVPVPLKVGVLSSVEPPGTMAPVLSPTLSLLPGVAGFVGAVASILITRGLVEGLELPAASVAITVNECAPSASGVVGVKLHWPFWAAVVVPSSVVPS